MILLFILQNTNLKEWINSYINKNILVIKIRTTHQYKRTVISPQLCNHQIDRFNKSIKYQNNT
ncbi:hypothetical protein CsatB_016990 [Cannabis sativa]